MTGIIYKITNVINNKVYIGKTLETLDTRWKQHKKDSARFSNRPLYKAMNKYSIENFVIEIIEEPTIDLLSERECYWIEQYNSFHFGYNATKGGDGKVLYDYQQIVNKYLEGALIKEIAEEFECSVDTVSKALSLAHLDSTTNLRKRFSKSVCVYNKNGEFIKSFQSLTEAANWLVEKQIAKTDNIKNIIATIGRAVNGQRKTAYKMLWKTTD